MPLSNMLHVWRSLNIVVDNTIIEVFDLDTDMSIRVLQLCANFMALPTPS